MPLDSDHEFVVRCAPMAKPTPKCREGHPMTTSNTVVCTARGRQFKRCRICWNAYRRERRRLGLEAKP